ncbi:MAG: TIGR03905 family TSCPD domain-containing protein [Muribaculaceae bacterium]|nr:TIGR03905 family TSCPD domain-containing protein [Muribaculaceae bacterium]
MHYIYNTKGTCSTAIEFDIDATGRVHNLKFHGGCPGNTMGLTLMAEGRDAAQVAQLLRGTDCRGRGTSCPDQLAQALSEALASTQS